MAAPTETDKNAKLKLTIAAAAIVVAGGILAWQYIPWGDSKEKSKAPAPPAVRTSTDKDGSKVINQGSHAQKEPAEKK